MIERLQWNAHTLISDAILQKLCFLNEVTNKEVIAQITASLIFILFFSDFIHNILSKTNDLVYVVILFLQF